MIRTATEADHDVVRELYEELLVQMEGEPEWLRNTWADEREYVEKELADGRVLLLEEEGEPVAFAMLEFDSSQTGVVDALHVRERARRRGYAKQLLAEATRRIREAGRTHVYLDVYEANAPARALYDKLGFKTVERGLATDVESLEARLAGGEKGASFGSVHVQTDDAGAVERAVGQFLPRMGRTGGTVVTGPRSGWVAVYDELCDREPKFLRRLARELSDRMGAVVLSLGVEEGAVVRFVLLERGTVMDEYLSVQEYYGPLPPGEVVALAANPRVVARLTGANAEAVRAASLHAKNPGDLPPAPELLAGIAHAMGIEGGEVGYMHVAGAH